MDFKSRPSRPSSIDGFVSRPRPTLDPRQTNESGYSGLQRRSTIGFDNSSRQRNAQLPKGQPMPQSDQRQNNMFANYYSSYSGAQTNAQPQPHLKKKKRRSWKKIFVRSGLGILVIGLLVGGWLGWKILGNIDKVFHGNIFSDAQALVSSTTLKGQAQGRINILVLGDSSDRADPSANGGDLTDSMMVLSIDTKNQTAFMLSIPRDMWVNVPGEGYGKINSTYEYDGFSGVENLIRNDLGIPIDYYALVNYQAFEDVVNAVGGITIDIQSPDPRGLYDPQPYPGSTAFRMTNGWHTINGAQALNLARARGDAYGSYGFPDSDFDRTQHQRQMVVAIAQKAESAGVVSNPIKVSNIFNALGKNVVTNLNLPDVLELIKLTKNININNIKSLAYSYGGSNPLLENYSSNGVEALAPTAGVGNYSQLQSFYNQQVSNNPVVQEGATAVVLNGSDVIGLSHKEASVLESEGFDVTSVTDATNEYPDSMVIDMSKGKDPAAKQALQQLFSSDTTFTTSSTTPAEATESANYNADFVIVLGKNWDGTTINSTSSTGTGTSGTP